MLNLMIVDDDLDDLFFFREAVESMGEDFHCIEQNCGIKALKYLKSSLDLPDVIFLDVNMPKMDGKECLQEIKKDARLKQIVVIMYSTSNHNNDRSYCDELGAAGFFIKLADTSKIKDGIVTALNGAGVVFSIHE